MSDLGIPMLLVLPSRGQVFQLDPIALTRASAHPREVRKANLGALIVDEVHGIRRVERIQFLGPLGETAWGRLWSRLINAWLIAVELSEPLQMPIAELKELLRRCIENDPEELQVRDRRGFMEAASYPALFAALELRALEDCLDVF